MGENLLKSRGWLKWPWRWGRAMVNRPTPAGTQLGAVAVEAAIVLPLIFLLIFGILDLTILTRSDIALTAATRNAVRIASAMPKDETFASAATEAVLRGASGLPSADIAEIWVYQANSEGLPGNATRGFPSSCPANCLQYQVVDGVATLQGGQWDSHTINACPGSTDTIGVMVRGQVQPLTGGLVPATEVSRRSVMKFEPVVSELIPCSG